jgi:hypothetical protein
MVFDQDLLLKDLEDMDWLIPKFNDPRLLGSESVNECDLFMLLRDFSYKEQIGYLSRSTEDIHKLEMSMDKLMIRRGPDDKMRDHLSSSKERLFKLKPLMEKRQTYIHKLIPKEKD